MQQFESLGQTVMPVAVNGVMKGLITLADTPRAGSQAEPSPN